MWAQILCYKNRESIDIILILHFYENSMDILPILIHHISSKQRKLYLLMLTNPL